MNKYAIGALALLAVALMGCDVQKEYDCRFNPEKNPACEGPGDKDSGGAGSTDNDGGPATGDSDSSNQ